MSKSNDSSKLGRAPQVRELRDDELQEVSGGTFTDGDGGERERRRPRHRRRRHRHRGLGRYKEQSLLMEKIMSKSNDSSKLGRAPQVRELRDDELQEVSGGVTLENTMISGYSVVATGGNGGGAGPAIAAWNFVDGWPTK